MTKKQPQGHQMSSHKLEERTEKREQKREIFKNIRFSVLFSLLSLLLITACHNSASDKDGNLYAPFLLTRSGTIDSLVEVMTLDEKLGQLVFVETEVSRDKSLLDLSELVEKQQISGFLLSYHLSKDSVYFSSIDSLQARSPIPLLVGLAPNNYSSSLMLSYNLSAIVEDSIKHQIIEKNQKNYNQSNYDIAFEVDLGTITQQDTSLQDSFFVKQQIDVLANSSFITNTYQSNGILTGINSCVDFKMNLKPTDYYSKNTYLPYQNVARNGASLIYLDNKTFTSDTLKLVEQNGVRRFLADSLDFRGLSFAHAGDKEYLEQQFRTGIDAFIVQDIEVDNVLKTLKTTFEKGLVTQKQLDESVKKVLMAKDWTSRFETIKDTTDFNIKEFEENIDFINKVEEHSTTVIKDDNNLLPFKEKANQNILIIKTGFFQSIDDLPKHESYTFSDNYIFHRKPIIDEDKLKLKKIDKYDLVIITINDEYPIEFYSDLRLLENKKNVVLIYIGNLSKLANLDKFNTIIHEDIGRYNAILSIFGKKKALGQTAMNVSKNIKYGQSKPLKKQLQLRSRYFVKLHSSNHPLRKIDTIVQEGIKEKAMPSCQVMVIKNGEIYFKKAYGHHTYNRKTAVDLDHIYDLASITKVMSTTMAMMKLYENGKYKLTDSLYQILDLEKNATIRNITVKELLIHQSGLQANMPITKFFKKRNRYTSKRQENATIQISDNFYLYDKYLDTLWHEIQSLEIGEKKYQYSDVNANILQRIIEKLSGKDLDDYVNTTFYEPLLMAHTLYQPLNKYKKKTIVPTEKDNFWRKRLVHGYVHDESAGLIGGVAGNAGLFSNVNDMAIMSQMLLNGGTYNGARYLKKETIDFFTASTHGNHRGLGFNKQTEGGSTGCASVAPLTTYGHTGFTGNCFWIDPENELIYIFLSNRVYPKRNPRLSQLAD